MKTNVGTTALVAAGAAIAAPGIAEAEMLSPSMLTSNAPGLPADGRTATPAEVHAAMQAMGVQLAETPVSRILAAAGPTGGVATPQKVVCSSGSYCVVVKSPQKSSLDGQESADATGALVASIRAAKPATAGAVLAEMSRHLDAGRPWSMTLGADGSVFVA